MQQCRRCQPLTRRGGSDPPGSPVSIFPSLIHHRENCRADQLDPLEFGPEFADFALEFGFWLDEVALVATPPVKPARTASVIASARQALKPLAANWRVATRVSKGMFAIWKHWCSGPHGHG